MRLIFGQWYPFFSFILIFVNFKLNFFFFFFLRIRYFLFFILLLNGRQKEYVQDYVFFIYFSCIKKYRLDQVDLSNQKLGKISPTFQKLGKSSRFYTPFNQKNLKPKWVSSTTEVVWSSGVG